MLEPARKEMMDSAASQLLEHCATSFPMFVCVSVVFVFDLLLLMQDVVGWLGSRF